MSWQPDYASVDDLKRYLRIPGNYPGTTNTSEDTYDDAELALAITSASRAIDNYCNRQFGVLSEPAAFRYTAQYDATRSKYVADIDDLMTTVSLVVESAGTATVDYDLLPLNAQAKGKPWTQIVFDYSPSTGEGDIEVTALFGWTNVPNAVKTATLIQAARIYKRKDAPFGVQGSTDMGTDIRIASKYLDADVVAILTPLRRWWGAQ